MQKRRHSTEHHPLAKPHVLPGPLSHVATTSTWVNARLCYREWVLIVNCSWLRDMMFFSTWWCSWNAVTAFLFGREGVPQQTEFPIWLLQSRDNIQMLLRSPFSGKYLIFWKAGPAQSMHMTFETVEPTGQKKQVPCIGRRIWPLRDDKWTDKIAYWLL